MKLILLQCICAACAKLQSLATSSREFVANIALADIEAKGNDIRALQEKYSADREEVDVQFKKAVAAFEELAVFKKDRVQAAFYSKWHKIDSERDKLIALRSEARNHARS